jgi:predicted nucleic acid-binding Zn ribbon protein
VDDVAYEKQQQQAKADFLAKFAQGAPEPSKLARPRKNRQGAAPKAKKARKENKISASQKATVTATGRVREYVGQPFRVSVNKLYCDACKCELALKRSTIKDHIISAKHARSLAYADAEKARKAGVQATLTEALKGGDVANAAADATPPFQVVATPEPKDIVLHGNAEKCIEIAHVFLYHGLPMSILRDPNNPMRRALELGRGTLTERSVASYVPNLREAEYHQVLSDLKRSPGASFCFDTTQECAELFAVVVRYVGTNHTICHRCLSFKMLAKSMDSRAIFQHIWKTLITPAEAFGVADAHWHYVARDGCAANNAAVHLLEETCNQLVDFICLSHTANNAGKLLCESCEYATAFVDAWASMLSRSGRVRDNFRELTGETARRKSPTRWFTVWEVSEQVQRHLSHVEAIANDNTLGCEELRAKLRKLLHNHGRELRLQLALIVDAGKSLCVLCYHSEGDAFLAPRTYAAVSKVLKRGHSITARDEHNPGGVPSHVPLVEAELEAIYPDDPQQQLAALMDTVRLAEPAFDKFGGDVEGRRLQDAVLCYRLCRLWDYTFVAQHTVASLLVELDTYAPTLPHIQRMLAGLRTELPAYKARAEATVAAPPEDYAPQEGEYREATEARAGWEFWRGQQILLPYWYGGAVEVALIMPSSACVERVFSVYSALFTDTNASTLEDRRECTVMMRYNEVRRENGR